MDTATECIHSASSAPSDPGHLAVKSTLLKAPTGTQAGAHCLDATVQHLCFHVGAIKDWKQTKVSMDQKTLSLAASVRFIEPTNDPRRS